MLEFQYQVAADRWVWRRKEVRCYSRRSEEPEAVGVPEISRSVL